MWEFIFEAVQSSGPALVLFAVAVLVGAALEIWVWGYVHRRELERVRRECDRATQNAEFWREKALTALGLGEEISEIAASLAEETTS